MQTTIPIASQDESPSEARLRSRRPSFLVEAFGHDNRFEDRPALGQLTFVVEINPHRRSPGEVPRKSRQMSRSVDLPTRQVLC